MNTFPWKPYHRAMSFLTSYNSTGQPLPDGLPNATPLRRFSPDAARLNARCGRRTIAAALRAIRAHSRERARSERRHMLYVAGEFPRK